MNDATIITSALQSKLPFGQMLAAHRTGGYRSPAQGAHLFPSPCLFVLRLAQHPHDTTLPWPALLSPITAGNA
jgi:hypothetical protein